MRRRVGVALAVAGTAGVVWLGMLGLPAFLAGFWLMLTEPEPGWPRPPVGEASSHVRAVPRWEVLYEPGMRPYDQDASAG